MLQPEQLRIGNWILEDSTIYTYGTSKTERPIDLSDFQVEDDYWYDHWDMIKPIPLNEDWLRNFKFADGNEFENTRGRWTKKKFAIMKTDWAEEESTWNLISTPNGDLTYWRHGKIPHIQYVHQLQNLFYALIGEELTLNN